MSVLRIVTIVMATLLIAIAPSARAQSPRPQFEVASVKLNNSSENSSMGGGAGRFATKNMTLRALIQFAYAKEGMMVLEDQIVGRPAWIKTDGFDVEGKPAGDNVEHTRLMMQSLLEDRFQLKMHHETRQISVYNLVTAKGGSKLKLSEDQTPPMPADASAPAPVSGEPNALKLSRGRSAMRPGPSCVTLAGRAVPIATADSTTNSSLQMLLQGALSTMTFDKKGLSGSPVVDRTGIKGLFDFQLKFAPQALAPDQTTDACGPSLFTAIQEQLGLKLESARGPVEVLVIDSVSRPTEN